MALSQRHPIRHAVVAMLFLLVGCSATVGVGFDSLLGYPGLGREITWFHSQRAWERNATCTGARITAFLRAEVVDETEDEIVARVRYRWQDRNRLGDRSGRIVRGGIGGRCQGVSERLFTLEKLDGDVRVVAMSGPQSPNPVGS